MLRYDRVRPFVLPGVLKLLGPIGAQVLIGRLSGTQFVRPSTLFGTAGVALGSALHSWREGLVQAHTEL